MGFLKADGTIYKPREDVDLCSDSHEIYVKADVKAPRMAGFVVKVDRGGEDEFLVSSYNGGLIVVAEELQFPVDAYCIETW
ncbi:hypothetical protein QQ045_017008 [Rhodiola kirilowii]